MKGTDPRTEVTAPLALADDRPPALPVERTDFSRSLSAGMALQFAAGGAVIPFVTLLFRDRGLDYKHISLIFSASSATLLVFPFVWGMLADRFLPLNRLFTLLNLLAFGSLALLRVQHSFGGLLVAYTCYFACFNPTLYLLNAISFHHLPNPREQFWVLRAWGSFGWIVPFIPISLGLLRGGTGDLNFIIYIGMICCLAMATLSFWLPHTPPGARRRRSGAALSGPSLAVPAISYAQAARTLVLNPNYLVILVSMFLMAGSFSLLTYYSPPLLEEAGVPRPWIGPVQAVGVLFEIILFQWQPAVLRRFNYTPVILIGCVALLLRQLLFGFITDPWLLSASYLLAGTMIVFYNQGVSLLANSLAAPQVRATAQTLLLFFGQGMGPLCANACAGHLTALGKDRLQPVFLFGALLAGMAAVIIALRGKRLDQPTVQ